MRFYLGFLIAFFVAVLLSPIIIKYCKKLKLGQNILHYVESHAKKQGTPTMGGLIFIIPILITGLFFSNDNILFGLVCLLIFLGYALIGFLDDFIKVKFKRNLGLRPYQKIIGQALIALIAGIYVYINPNIGSKILIPFIDIQLDLGIFIIPFVFLVFIATTNSVNLTDGLDGLAGGVSCVVFFAFGVLCLLSIKDMTSGLQEVAIIQTEILANLSFITSGALLGFLVFNCFPATIFMGDTGSLSLGAMLGVVATFSNMGLYILVIGVMYVVSALSVIIQVLYFKKTKKRVFLMAPLHHHFEKRGVNENKIVSIYIVITIIVSVISIMIKIL